MFLRDFIRKILGLKPLENGKHELDFTERTAKLPEAPYKIEPVLNASTKETEVIDSTETKKVRKPRTKKVKD